MIQQNILNNKVEYFWQIFLNLDTMADIANPFAIFFMISPDGTDGAMHAG